MTAYKDLEKVVFENSNNVYNLTAQMIELQVVQGAIGHLIEKIDDIKYKKWDEDPGKAYLAFGEIRDTVRLIDMAFLPLFKEMSKDVDAINVHADKFFEMVVKK